MKALCWHGKSDVRIDNVADPKIEDDRDAIIRITTTAICGSDLHLLNGCMPTMKAGDILTKENLRIVRPGLGLPPKFYDIFLGKRVNQDLFAGTPATWKLIA